MSVKRPQPGGSKRLCCYAPSGCEASEWQLGRKANMTGKSICVRFVRVEHLLPSVTGMWAGRNFKIWKMADSAIRDLARTWRDSSEISDLRSEAPWEIRQYLDGSSIVSLRNSSPSKNHYLFRIGGEMILHVYGLAASSIGRAVRERRALEAPSSIRVPQMYCAVEQGERMWILEERLHGETLPKEPVHRDCGKVREALAAMATQQGVVLRQSAFWDDHHNQSIEAAPAHLQKYVRKAWTQLGDLPSVPVHGDVQPKNILSGSSLGLVDWEGFWLEGLPGLDLAFFALMSDTSRPSGERFAELARGEGVFSKAVRAYFPDQVHYRAGLLVMLALWTNGENKRHSRDGATDRPRPFRSMLEGFGPKLPDL